MTEGRLHGKVALVTGAGQGIGRGIATALAKDGARVVLAGRTERTLRETAELIDTVPGVEPAVPIVCDVGERAQVDSLVAQLTEECGALDLLVNNAQSFAFGLLEELTEEDVMVMHRSGPLGAFHTMQACLPLLRASGGSVVNVATSSAMVGETRFGAYVMAKEAMRALSLVAATEWGPLGIRVNCICPNATSPAYDGWAAANPERAAEVAAARPLGRMGDPELDIGRAVCALATDDFRYLTGATLMLNGGRVYLR